MACPVIRTDCISSTTCSHPDRTTEEVVATAIDTETVEEVVMIATTVAEAATGAMVVEEGTGMVVVGMGTDVEGVGMEEEGVMVGAAGDMAVTEAQETIVEVEAGAMVVEVTGMVEGTDVVGADMVAVVASTVCCHTQNALNLCKCTLSLICTDAWNLVRREISCQRRCLYT